MFSPENPCGMLESASSLSTCCEFSLWSSIWNRTSLSHSQQKQISLSVPPFLVLSCALLDVWQIFRTVVRVFGSVMRVSLCQTDRLKKTNCGSFLQPLRVYPPASPFHSLSIFVTDTLSPMFLSVPVLVPYKKNERANPPWVRVCQLNAELFALQSLTQTLSASSFHIKMLVFLVLL